MPASQIDTSLKLSGRLVEGRRILILGAASQFGLGKAAAALLVEHGANVVIADIDHAEATRAAAEIGARRAIAYDARSVESGQAVVQEAHECLGGLDGFVNMVGYTGTQIIEDTTYDEYAKIFEINVRSSFILTKAAVPHLRASKSGSIVLMGSVAGQQGGGLYGTAAYCSSKAAVIGLAKALARELAPSGIRVNAIAPGLIDTDRRPAAESPSAIRQTYEKLLPMGRSGNKWETAGAVLFLLSDMSTFVTGATIDVNGGFSIR